MELVINGAECQLDARTIQDVIEHFKLTGKPVIVEADGVVLASEHWATTETKPHMRLELVHFVGGG